MYSPQFVDLHLHTRCILHTPVFLTNCRPYTDENPQPVAGDLLRCRPSFWWGTRRTSAYGCTDLLCWHLLWWRIPFTRLCTQIDDIIITYAKDVLTSSNVLSVQMSLLDICCSIFFRHMSLRKKTLKETTVGCTYFILPLYVIERKNTLSKGIQICTYFTLQI